jgi:flagellar hook protein FlgE
MLNSINIGISGMTAFSNGLETISNNVTNLNTDGFKASTVTFSDVFSYGGDGQSLTSNSNGNYGEGVVNGAKINDYAQGTLRQTGKALDLAIQGNGFLVLSKDGNIFYTRTGSFTVDNSGYIVRQGSTARLCVLNAAGQAVPVNIQSLTTNPPVATRCPRSTYTIQTAANTSGKRSSPRPPTVPIPGALPLPMTRVRRSAHRP